VGRIVTASSSAPWSAPWAAQWIEPVEPDGFRDVQRPVYQLVGTFSAGDVARAELRITAHGIYEAFLNGERIGDRELTPGFTAYRKNLQVQTYDVTAQLRTGINALGVQLSDGWWRGQYGVGRRTNSYGKTVAVLAELALTDSDGNTTTVGTDGSWVFAPSHVEGADLIAGEIHDMRLRNDAWSLPDADRSEWQPVRVADHGFDTLCETLGPPVRRMREIPAVSVTEVAPGRHIVDFGQVSNGWIRLTDLGPLDTQLTIVHGECLSPEGDDVQIEALSGGLDTHEGNDWELRFQTDVVTSAGDGAVFEPRHSTKGFRYLRIDGHPGPLDPSALTSVVVHSELPAIGSFECSDDDLTWLHTAADWSLRTNACDIPTDCPTRERAGWTGDWQIYVDTAAYLYDVTSFSLKWLRDVAAEQLSSGAILHFVPDTTDHTNPDAKWWTDLQGSAGWGDAVVHVPWELYRSTERPEVLEPSFAAMQRWVDFAAERAATGRHRTRAAARPEPAPHERYLWDSGFHFGEWNEPGNSTFETSPEDTGPAVDPEPETEEVALNPLAERLMAIDPGPTATAFLYRSSRELSQIAEVLGDRAVVGRYRDLANDARDAWRTEFIDADGHITPSTQPIIARALAFGLVPDEHRATAVEDLVRLIRAAGTHLGTGFLATPFLLPVLADNGHVDLAYEILFQRTAPSWLAMRDQGATTIWEGWTPFDDSGKVKESLNHFSMGACVGFLHRYVAGLQIVEPGYRRFRVAPKPGGGITWARTDHDSPYGRIEVAWQLDGDEGSIDVTVPDDTEADLVLPGSETERLTPGKHHRSW
jgi:alpha-L-rhamnosidase